MDGMRFLRFFSTKALTVMLIGAVALVGVACGGGEEATPTPTTTAIATPTPTPDLVAEGRQLFSDKGCIACHKINGEGGEVGPSMVGLFGSEEELTTGETVTVDHEYVEESLEDPNAKVVAGYPAVMPAFSLSHAEVDALIEFMESLAD